MSFKDSIIPVLYFRSVGVFLVRYRSDPKGSLDKVISTINSLCDEDDNSRSYVSLAYRCELSGKDYSLVPNDDFSSKVLDRVGASSFRGLKNCSTLQEFLGNNCSDRVVTVGSLLGNDNNNLVVPVFLCYNPTNTIETGVNPKPERAITTQVIIAPYSFNPQDYPELGVRLRGSYEL